MMPGLMVSQDEAVRERGRREKARRHLVDFSEYVFPWYQAAQHHRYVGELLELVLTYIQTKGKTGIGRLLILEPPRYGKSEQVSRHFPAWALGKANNMRVIIASYGADLAIKHSRAARDIVQSDRYRAIFGDLGTVDVPVEVSVSSSSAEAWDLADPLRGGVVASGVGGGITGSGAHLFIIDDPFKNREEAEAEAHRSKVWEWYTSTAYTRLEDGAAVVGMLTRWHADDWAGRLLKAMATDPLADRWVVVSLPAIWQPPVIPDGKTFDEYQRERMLDGIWVEQDDALGRKPGQALWPAKYNLVDLERIRANVGPYDWEALYQQQPYLRSGSLFQREWFTIVDMHPAPETITARIRYWDKAGNRSGQGGDYAVGVLMSLLKDDVIVVEHVHRGQYTPARREQAILDTAKNDRQRQGPPTIIWHQQDPGTSGLESAQNTNRRLAKEGFTAHFKTLSGDKVVRAGPWSTVCEGGQVRLVRAAWNEPFVEEHVAFPLGPVDDQVDVCSTAYSELTGRSAARKEARSYQG